MSGFLYFVDGLINPLTEAHISEYGLSHAFETKPPSGRIDGRTPSGNSGTLLADEKRLGACVMAYRPDEQVWRKMPGRDQVYVGFYKDARPGPETLKRAEQTPGDPVRMADGNEWLIPRLRFFDDANGFRTALPVSIDVNDDGALIVDGVSEKYKEIDDVGQALLSRMLESDLEDAPKMTTAEAVEFVGKLLARNYVVTLVELGGRMLGVLANDGSLVDACRAAVDYDTAVEWSKKNLAVGVDG